ncbi:hypothetical protein LX99_03603 [Mucilaginibacter oryzae]|uniref:Uncharacterized protein n=1 Tax=Mucilaginibacter oryzae TaxID=468058 RepID=A0A316H733_9SPHI|nr:hypothetical protein LX99_03603 [Mucilaginibacter oryzae]
MIIKQLLLCGNYCPAILNQGFFFKKGLSLSKNYGKTLQIYFQANAHIMQNNLFFDADAAGLISRVRSATRN